MTTPQDPRSGPPAGLGGQQPYGGAYDPYENRDPYNNRGFDIPNGIGRPTGWDNPPRRPATMVGAVVLTVLGAIPWLLSGAVLLASPLTEAQIQATGLLDNPGLADAGVTAATVISVVHSFAIIFLVLSLGYVGLAVFAFLGRSWARTVLTVLTAVFALFLLLGILVGGVADPGSTVLVAALVIVPVAGVVLMYLAPSSAWFASLRR